MDLSASRISYDSLAPLDAPSVSLLAEWQRPSLFGRLSGGATSFRGSGWSTQGRANLAGWLSPFGILSPIRLELGAGAGGSHHSSGFDSGVASLDGRVHLVGGGAGAWGGVRLSRAKNSYDSASIGVISPEAGAWMQSGWLRGMVSYEHTRISGDSYPEASVSLTLTRGALDVSAYGGAREWPGDAGLGDELWGGVSAVYWVTSHVAVTLSGGKYAWDVVQGLPGGDFVSIGVRLTPRRSRPIPLLATAPIVYTSEDVSSGAIAFDLDGVERVEIAGDWTGWEPVPMARDVAGRWVLPAELAPGTYRFNLRIDGERWIVPEGFVTIDDGFGGTVGLLIVSDSDTGM
ncbi:MAG: glycogen-binding domain-containing protein [Gemmatimonadota bacterium]|jgi:hypothetical protein